MNKTKRAALLNAIALAILYIYLIGSFFGVISETFNWLVIPALSIGLVSEIFFIINSFIKK